MSNATTNHLARQWFAQHIALAYWIARRRVVRLLDRAGYDYAASQVEELVQDAVARGYDRFCKVVLSKVTGKTAARWVGRCMVRACRDAVRNRSRFGSVTPPTVVRDDAMNRFRRVRPSGRHGSDEERDYLDVEYTPVTPEPQRWEVEAEIERQGIPEKLRQTAVFSAMGFTQEQSALLQGCTDRTVRNRLAEIRAYLDPQAESWYVIIADALRASLADKAWTVA
jgi:DNA-directed RNA polymerase specialized sigma24 family protein